MYLEWNYLVQKLVAVEEGQGTLSDAVNKALQYWVSHVIDTHYLLGSALGPDPFPTIVRDFRRTVIGKEIKSQILKKEGQLSGCNCSMYRWWLKCNRYILSIY